MPKFTAQDLAAKHSQAYKAYYKPNAPSTCYDAAVFSLTLTGELKEGVWKAWRGDGAKADTHLVVVPERDTRIASVGAIPPNALIGFYRRTYKGETPPIESEKTTGWILYHMVRSMDTAGSVVVVGSNNGDRENTNPAWSGNDVGKMFDWTGASQTGSIFLGDPLPGAGSYGVGGAEKYVAFAATIATVVARLNKAFPGPAAF